MSAPVFLPKAPRALLCIHGAGCSSAIFRVQLSKLRAALREDFEFVYATAPFPSAPGPGILSTFEGLGLYYTWFEDSPSGVAAKVAAAAAATTTKGNTTNQKEDDDGNSSDSSDSNFSQVTSPSDTYSYHDSNSPPSVHDRLAAIHAPIYRTITDWQTQNPDIPIVGTISFSQGALMTALLLWQQQMGTIHWLPVIRVALFICCWYQDEATEYMRADVMGCGNNTSSSSSSSDEVDEVEEKLRIRGFPSLHLQGRHDFTLKGSQALVARHFVPGEEAEVLEFAGGHHFPNRPRDVLETVKRFRGLCVKAKVLE